MRAELREGNREWELRNRLTRNAARMRGEHVAVLLDELSVLPAAIATPILAAWNAKEDLLDLVLRHDLPGGPTVQSV